MAEKTALFDEALECMMAACLRASSSKTGKASKAEISCSLVENRSQAVAKVPEHAATGNKVAGGRLNSAPGRVSHEWLDEIISMVQESASAEILIFSPI